MNTSLTNLLLGLRALIFYAGYAVLTIWFSATGVLFFSFLPYRIRVPYVLGWNRCTIAWAKLVCGLDYEVIGKENLPDGAYVALANHQSQWETYFLQYFLSPVCIVLKRELLQVPFFGWGLRLTNPIAIDRGSPRQAIRQTIEQGLEHLDNKISVLIFPEGTRTRPGAQSKYARGGANIAVKGAVPIVPIAINAGEFWPADKFLKYPGKITVSIGKPISTDQQGSREVTEQAKIWIEAQLATMTK